MFCSNIILKKHNWTKWRDCEGFRIVGDISNKPLGRMFIQEKECLDCGKRKVRKVETRY